MLNSTQDIEGFIINNSGLIDRFDTCFFSSSKAKLTSFVTTKVSPSSICLSHF